ncbi:MAG TPA: hypothetical protein VIJ09_06675, partial [Acidimicrobiales bacterium]
MAEVSVRYTYRLRVSHTAEALLLAEWGRDRWVWNECVARSKVLRLAGETCGPARLDKDPTKARSTNTWLAEGSSVPQQQTIRDFGAARAEGHQGHLGPVTDETTPGVPGAEEEAGGPAVDEL